MSKLVEAEMDGAAAAKQVMALEGHHRKLKSVSGRFRAAQPRAGPAERGHLQTGGSLRSHHAGLYDIFRPGQGTLTLSTPPLFSLLGPDPEDDLW